MKNYLFICQHNFTRSRYATEFFRGFLKGRNKEAKVYSAGLGLSSIFFGRRVKKKFVEKMDWIFVMEKYMEKLLIEKYGVDKKKIVVLNIKDIYGIFRKRTVDDLDKLLEKINFEKYI